MPANAGVLNIQIRVKDDGSVVVEQFGKKVEDAGKKSEQSFGLAGQALDGLILKMGKLFAAYKIEQFVQDSVMMAARYETLGVVMETVGHNAGYTAAQLNAQADALQKSGISMIASREGITKLIQAHIGLENATKLSRIAQDAAVIANMNSSEAFKQLVYGIETEQVRVLKTMGINVNFEASYRSLAAQLHKTTGELTESERVQARLNAVFERGSDIAGVYEASMGTAGKRMLSLQRYVDDFKVKMGEAFQPAFAVIIDKATDALKEFTKEIEKENSQSGLTDLSNGVATLGSALIKLSTWIVSGGTSVISFFSKFSDFAASLGLASSGFIRFSEVFEGSDARREMIKNFDLNPEIVKLNSQKKLIEDTITDLRDKLDENELTIRRMSRINPDYFPGLQRQLDTKLAELDKVNKAIQKAIPSDKKINHEETVKKPPPKPDPISPEKLKEREKLLSDFNDRYRKIGLSSYDIERMQIDDLAKKWKQQGFDKIKIAEIVKAAKEDIQKRENAKNLEVQKEFEDKYREIGLSKYDIEALKIDDMAKKYKDAGADKIKVAQWVENEKTRIAEEADAKRQETLQEFNKLTLSSFAVERMEIEARAKKYLEDGVDRVKLEEWVSDQLAQIRQKEEEDRLRKSREWKDGAIRALKDYQDRATDMASGVECAFSNAFSGMEDSLVKFATTGKLSFTDMVNSMIADIARLAIRQNITAPLASALMSGMSSWFGSGDGFKTGVGIDAAPAGSPMMSAHGNVFDITGYKKFALGGVFTNHIVDRPTPFLFGRGGSFGVMGEAGDEAVVPLVRTKSGNLGIRSEGTQEPVINVTINNQASNATGRVDSMSKNSQGGIDLSIIIEQIDGAMAAGITSGRSALSSALESQYGMNRAYGVRR